MKCFSERANLIAAILGTIGSTMGAYALYAVPKTTLPKSISAASAALVVTGSVVWIASAIASYIECLLQPGNRAASMEELDKEIQKLRGIVNSLRASARASTSLF